MSTQPRRRVDRGQAGKLLKRETHPADSSEHLCIICAEPIIYAAVSPCNNVTCHLCTFRQRALYGKKTCLVCRTEHDDVIFTEQQTSDDSKFDMFVGGSRNIHDAKHGIHFTAQYVYDDTEKLLLISCSACSETFANFDQLSKHTKEVHQRQFCDICATHKKAFVSELTLYTAKQLQNHINDGDSKGFKGHPKCRFCRNKRFYSEDELNVHIRDRHERCYICDQDRHALHEYYRNYDDLYDHFRAAHYVCPIPSCVEKRFVVFREDLDLTAHMLKEHGGLTGQNGRVVIGATLSQFQLQLLTFPRKNGTKSDTDSRDTKKRRFEERAKHYLNNDQAAMAKFNQLNNQFKSRRLTALQLVEGYQELFTSEHLDVSLLVYELAELYSDYSEQKTHLEKAYKELNPTAVSPDISEKFPVLGNGLSLSILNSSWGTGRSRKTQEELFPALAKPSRTTSPVIKNAPVRYTVLKKPTPKPSVKVNTFQENVNFRPRYLENMQKTVSESSLPILGSSGSVSASSSQGLSRTHLPISHIASSSSLSEDKFPTLTKKTSKKPIPPVKPVVKSAGSWGQGLTPAAPKVEDTWGITIVDKKAEKLRRKQEKLQKKTN